jgi:3-hydroxybutyryl-CoA dehydratase
MNNFSFQDISEGQTTEFSETISSEMVENFIKLTGDINPLHSSKEYAIQKGFSNVVVHGLLTTSFLSKMAGVYLPGEKCLLMGVDVSFLKPVFPGDKLLFKGVVKDKNEDFKCFTLRVIASNQQEMKVLRGSIKVGFHE